MTESEYEIESTKVIRNAWIEYRAEEADPAAYIDAYKNPGAPVYHQEARYYTDARLVRTIVNAHNDEIRTCYHEHFDRKHEMGSGSLTAKSKNLEMIIKYLNRLRHRRRAAQLKNFKVVAANGSLPRQIHLMIDELKA